MVVTNLLEPHLAINTLLRQSLKPLHLSTMLMTLILFLINLKTRTNIDFSLLIYSIVCPICKFIHIQSNDYIEEMVEHY